MNSLFSMLVYVALVNVIVSVSIRSEAKSSFHSRPESPCSFSDITNFYLSVRPFRCESPISNFVQYAQETRRCTIPGIENRLPYFFRGQELYVTCTDGSHFYQCYGGGHVDGHLAKWGPIFGGRSVINRSYVPSLFRVGSWRHDRRLKKLAAA